MAIFNREFKQILKINIIFFIIYTIAFIFIQKTFPYIAPFFIGLIIALIINPISQRLEKKLHINKGISTILLSFIGVSIVISIAIIIVIHGTKELIGFLNHIDTNYSYINRIIYIIISKFSIYFENIKEISNFNIEDLIGNYSTELLNISKNLLVNIIELATSIPYLVILIITLFISTYFIANDLDNIENIFYSVFTNKAKNKIKNIKREVKVSILGYIKAYTILMGITFLAIWISFSFLGIKYSFILGIIGGLFDLIPFLGIVIIFVPIIIYNLIIDNYFISISVSIIFLVLSILRQILEPKLVSAHIGINPLVTVIAIFIGLQAKGIIGIIFCLGLVIMHDILRKVEIL